MPLISSQPTLLKSLLWPTALHISRFSDPLSATDPTLSHPTSSSLRGQIKQRDELPLKTQSAVGMGTEPERVHMDGRVLHGRPLPHIVWGFGTSCLLSVLQGLWVCLHYCIPWKANSALLILWLTQSRFPLGINPKVRVLSAKQSLPASLCVACLFYFFWSSTSEVQSSLRALSLHLVLYIFLKLKLG